MLEREAPDLEDLAAYMDGRLSGERKAQVEEHLARDEEYYELFLESTRFQQEQSRQQVAELQDEGGPDPIIGAQVLKWRFWRFGAPILAAAVLSVVVFGVLRFAGKPPDGGWVSLVNPGSIVRPSTITPPGQPEWYDPGWSRLRSGNYSGVDPYQVHERSFRLGALTVELKVALLMGDRDSARTIAAGLKNLANAADLFVTAVQFEQLQTQLGSSPIETLLSQAEHAEEILAESFNSGSLEARRFSLGTWAESGRLVALSDNSDALSRVLRGAPRAKSVEEIRPQLEKLAEIENRPDLTRREFEEAESVFKEILYALAG